MAAILQHRCRVETPSRQPVPFSLRFLPFFVLWGTVKASQSVQLQGMCCATSQPSRKNSEVATLQLNTAVHWLCASFQILVLLLAVSTGSLGRKKTSVTRQSIQSRRQCWVLHGDLWAMHQLVSYGVITPLVSTYWLFPPRGFKIHITRIVCTAVIGLAFLFEMLLISVHMYRGTVDWSATLREQPVTSTMPVAACPILLLPRLTWTVFH